MKSTLPRVMTILLLLALVAGAIYILFYTPAGAHYRDWKHFHEHREEARQWVHRHPLLGPGALVVAYVVLGVLVIPVWWLQLLAGYCFGPFLGIFWCAVGATASAVMGCQISRWLAADYFHKKLESRMERLRKLDETMGHNGLLVM